jgi:hypothetical protein
MGVVVSGQGGVGRVGQRLVVGLTRAGVSVRGARELLVERSSGGDPLRALVFPVSVDGVEYLVTNRPDARWVKRLRAAGSGELRVGRRRSRFRATEVATADTTRFLQQYQRQVPSLLAREPATSARAVVFRIDGEPS